MHLEKLLHTLFEKSAEKVDKRNHKTLLKSAITLCECKHLSIAALGRNLNSQAKVKHNIKRIDRLFGNKHLQQSQLDYYQQMTEIVIQSTSQPTISIDWSGLTPCGEFHLLRASCPVKGRAITVYEQSYHESEYLSLRVHKQFLNSLKKVLPKNCKPIIVTDAGFRNTWFKLITEMNWDFVGRVRNRTQYKSLDTQQWLPVKALYSNACQKPHYLFETELAKANAVSGHFYLYKAVPKKRKHKNLRGKRVRCSTSLKHAKRGHEPWLIFTSLSNEVVTAQQVIKIYAQRMQIEEGFRDLKNTNNGLSLRHCRSYTKGRLNMALLIAAIASLLLWLLGLMAKRQNLHYSFQANTVKTRNVLSSFMIGWQYLKRYGNNIKSVYFKQAITDLNRDFCECL